MDSPRPPSRRRRVLVWLLVVAASVPIVLATASLFILQPNRFRPMAERKLSERLGLEVTIESLTLSIVPTWRLAGTNLAFRVPGKPDLPPFVLIDHFWMDVGLLSAIRKRVDTLHVGGLQINVPPDDRPDFDMGSGAEGAGDVIINRLESENAVLAILRKKPGRSPLVFQIHRLEVRDVGFGRTMPFSTTLTNPVPEGLVESSGTIGPWQKGMPALLPLAGKYTFKRADLDTIKGIGGMLASEGSYEGQLTEIRVSGWTDTPDFNLDMGGRPVPLKTTFKAVVDGSNGSTILESVDASLFATPLHVTGAVENLPGPGRHDINLQVAVEKGRIEDILRLAIDSPKPMLTGDVMLRTTVALPPGKGLVRDRLKLNGQFALARAQFTDGTIQAKLQELSLRSRGRKQETVAPASGPRVMTDLKGRFVMSGGALTLDKVTFAVPGAVVLLDGRYQMASRQMVFEGTLRMQATVSQAVGGLKSVFIRPFDWLFRRDGAGAIVPIRISGTPDAPKLGIRFGKVFSRSE